MYPELQYKQNRLRPIIITFICFFVGIIIISAIAMSGIFHKNPYGPEIKVTNFDRAIKGVPEDTRDVLFYSLYQQVEKYYHGDVNISKIKATIRKNSITTTPVDDNGAVTTSFLVDLPDIEQTYHLDVSYYVEKDLKNNTNIDYRAMVLCPETSELIYPAFECSDIITEDPTNSLYDRFPIIGEMPLRYDFYSDDGTYYKFTLRWRPNDDFSNLYFIISDYSGNSEEIAKKILTEKGIDINKVKVEYENLYAPIDTGTNQTL